MNAAVIATAPHYRPQLGVGVSTGTLTQNPSNGSVLDRDPHPMVTSPLSPSSDFSFSKYQTDNTYQQHQQQQHQQRGQMGFANPSLNAPDGGAGGGAGVLSQSGSNMSLASNRSEGSIGERDSVVMEHYMRLKNYLTRQYSVDGLNQRQNKAREKLIRLSKQQFNELSTDVYDELMRRQNTQTNHPFLVPKDNFHPKRNQARQKLATLPPTRFKELASDVLYEIERRYPSVIDSATNSQQYLTPSTDDTVPRVQSNSSIGSQRSDQSYNQPYTPRNDSFPSSASRDRFPSSTSSNNLASTPIPEEPEDTDPVQRSGMQNTIIPNKSTMVEEDLPDYEEGTLNRSTNGPNPEKKTFMANTIVPNTSMMVEEDPDDDEEDLQEQQEQQQQQQQQQRTSTIASTKSLSPPVFKSNAFSNANGSRNRSISPPPVLPKSRAQIEEQARRDQQVQDKMDEYEDQIEALKERIAELQGELRSVKQELQEERSKPPPTPPPSNDRRLRDLEEENTLLKEELREQQEVTNDVRREATELLEEMKLLTTQQETYFDTHTTSTREISRLNAELRDWKSRYTQLKIQLKSHTRSPSSSNLSTPTTIISPSSTSRPAQHRPLPTSVDGCIQQTSLTRFQNAIDELLAAARRDDDDNGADALVMDAMTEVVKATRGISDDIRKFGPPGGTDSGEKVKKLTMRLSATANNVITATKNFVGSSGLSPVSLVDAAASHLTSTVVELCKLVKLRPATTTSGTSFRTDEDTLSDRSRLSELATPLASPLTTVSPSGHTKPAALNLGSRSNLVARTSLDHTTATMGGYPRTPESPLGGGGGGGGPFSPSSEAVQEEELRVYLDTQTRNIVESIQSLLTRIRNPKLDSPEDFRAQIDEITGIVEQIVEYTDRQGGKMERFLGGGGAGEGGRLMSVLRSLEDCCGLMRSIVSPASSGASDDGFKKRLARIAFDISKQIKELVRIVESESPLSSGNDLT